MVNELVFTHHNFLLSFSRYRLTTYDWLSTTHYLLFGYCILLSSDSGDSIAVFFNSIRQPDNQLDRPLQAEEGQHQCSEHVVVYST